MYSVELCDPNFLIKLMENVIYFYMANHDHSDEACQSKSLFHHKIEILRNVINNLSDQRCSPRPVQGLFSFIVWPLWPRGSDWLIKKITCFHWLRSKVRQMKLPGWRCLVSIGKIYVIDVCGSLALNCCDNTVHAQQRMVKQYQACSTPSLNGFTSHKTLL